MAIRASRLPALAAVLLGGVSLTACASTTTARLTTPLYPTRIEQAAYPPADTQTAAPQTQGRYKVGSPYEIRGVTYTPAEQPDYDQEGIASWYGDAFHLKPTANGETFDQGLMTAAHTTLPLPSMVEVTNLDNGRMIHVRVNDRGPFIDNRIIDLSRGAAEELGMLQAGLARVRVRYVGPAPLGEPGDLQIAAGPPPQSWNEPLYNAPAIVSSEPLPAPPAPTPVVQYAAYEPTPVAPVAVEIAPAFEVQAGAFSTMANAERARSQLAGAGEVLIRPIERDGAMLYRVVVARLGSEGEAMAIAERVGGLGFPGARVVKPF